MPSHGRAWWQHGQNSLPSYSTQSLFMIRQLLLGGCLLLATMAHNQEIPFLETNPNGGLQLTEAGASHFAQLALTCMQQEYPNKLNQVLQDEGQLKGPKALHPAFYGCFDWHSAVHGHWMLIRLLKEFPGLPEEQEIRQKLSENLTSVNILAEVEYLRTASPAWERMYGWSWLLKLAEELHTWEDAQGQQWSHNLQPLTDAIIQRYIKFLPLQTYPVRTGVHPNTAFGMSFAWDYAQAAGRYDLKNLLEERAITYFSADQNCPASWEPSGEDFLSACLEEANLMARILPESQFLVWFEKFLPPHEMNSLLHPASVADRSDPKIVHLDGVNLSRAWSMYQLLPLLRDPAQKALLSQAAARHLNATVPYIASEYYEGTHWLASFAVYALSVHLK